MVKIRDNRLIVLYLHPGPIFYSKFFPLSITISSCRGWLYLQAAELRSCLGVSFYGRYSCRLSVWEQTSMRTRCSWPSLGFTPCTTWRFCLGTGSLKSFRYSLIKVKNWRQTQRQLLLQKCGVEHRTGLRQLCSSSAWKLCSIGHGAQPPAVCRSEQQARIEARGFQTR